MRFVFCGQRPPLPPGTGQHGRREKLEVRGGTGQHGRREKLEVLLAPATQMTKNGVPSIIPRTAI
eukprot:scaffold19080_cov158-Skeletonema_marinoi.AAC.4